MLDWHLAQSVQRAHGGNRKRGGRREKEGEEVLLSFFVWYMIQTSYRE